MINKLYQEDKRTNFPARLQRLAKAWTKRWEGPLRHRQELLKLWASGFFDSGYIREHLINFIGRGVSAIQPYLVEGNPKISVSTLVSQFRPYAYTSQLALNFLINKMNLAENVLIPAAINSMFGAAITRIMFNYNKRISLNDEIIKIGTPWISVIDDSSYVGDSSAKRRSDFAFEGDIYRLPTAYAKDLYAGKDKFGKQIADYIQPDCKLVDKYSPQEISDPKFTHDKLALRDFTTFIDFYLYDSNEILTIQPEGHYAKILKTENWDGPEGGPYDYVGYNYFPECPIPIPPAWAWYDLDVSTNMIAKVAREQAESQKDIIVVDAGQEELGKKIVNAKNMDVIPSANAAAAQKISFGGANEINYNWMVWAEQEFTKSGANPDVLGGRGSQAPTLGQEELVFQNATRVISNMYNRFQSFMTSIVEKLAWYVWEEPNVIMEFVETVPGVGDIPYVFSQADKVGDYRDFVFDIEPYSSQRSTPEIKYSRLMQFLTTWIIPTMQMAQMQGAQLDIPTVSKILAGYQDIETIAQWYKTIVPDAPNDKQMPWLTTGDKNKQGQGNDAFGALDFSRVADKEQQQEKTVGSVAGFGTREV